MGFQVNEPFALDGAAGAAPGAGLFNVVELEIPKNVRAIVALYGEAKTNPAGSALDRIVAGLEWAATFTPSAPGGAETQPAFSLSPGKGSGGRLTWTYSDGTALATIVLRSPGTFRFGPFQTAALPAAVVSAIAKLRGIFLPDTVSPEELIRMVSLWR